MTHTTDQQGLFRPSMRRACRLGCTAIAAIASALLVGGGMAAAQTAQTAPAPPSVVQVEAGDTFSGIAARYTGNVSSWRKLYRADLSRLPDPNRIAVGMRFEAVTDADGALYLRVMAPAQSARRTTPPEQRVAAAAPQAAAPAPAAATTAPAATPLGVAGADKTLVIGVLPNIPAPALTAQYLRMKRYLERGNEQTVNIVVPRNFKEFYESMMRGDYDVAIAAPHFARIAQVDRNMVPLLTYQPQINGLFISTSESTLKGPRDARERVVAFANPQSLVAMYGRQWLKQAGLEAGADYEMRAARTDLGVGRMLLSGDVVAAIMSNGEFRALPPDEASRLKVVEVFARIPNFIFMAHPRIERARLGRLKTQLQGFLADAEEGVPFAAASGFTGIVDIDAATMRELDSFTEATRRAMGSAP